MGIDDEISILWLRRCLRLQKAFHPRPIDQKKAPNRNSIMKLILLVNVP